MHTCKFVLKIVDQIPIGYCSVYFGIGYCHHYEIGITIIIMLSKVIEHIFLNMISCQYPNRHSYHMDDNDMDY